MKFAGSPFIIRWSWRQHDKYFELQSSSLNGDWRLSNMSFKCLEFQMFFLERDNVVYIDDLKRERKGDEGSLLVEAARGRSFEEVEMVLIWVRTELGDKGWVTWLIAIVPQVRLPELPEVVSFLASSLQHFFKRSMPLSSDEWRLGWWKFHRSSQNWTMLHHRTILILERQILHTSR